jgi:hypothetical protein
MLKLKPALKLAPKVDEEFAALIAPLSAEEYQQLQANLIAQGCRDPLVVWRGLLLDGHSRLGICTRHKIAYETTEIELPDREAARIWVEENQLGRRNLSDDQKVALAYRVMQRRVKLSKHRRVEKAWASRMDVVHVGHHQDSPRQRERTAREHKISTRKLREIAALAKTDPEIVTRIANAEISLREAKEATLEQVRQRNITAALKTPVRGTGIHTGHIRQLFRILENDSVDLCITDPPWAKSALPLYTELGNLAQQKLKPGGFCFVLCGQLYLNEIIARLSDSLDWYWLSALSFPSSHAQIWTRKINNRFRPMLVFAKRPAPAQAKQWIDDMVQNRLCAGIR